MSFTSKGTEVMQCPKCMQQATVEWKLWEPSDEAYEDYHYKCLECGHTWWIDGIDS